MNLPDTSTLTATIKVHESRIGQVGVGQAAYVTLDVFPDKRFRGEVYKVAPMPDPSSWWNPNLKVYSTQIVIKDDLPKDVKPGLSAKAEIIIDKLENVLHVPVQAVTTQNRTQVCYRKRNGTFDVVPVELGPYNETNVVILEGLAEGDEVMLDPPATEEALALGLSIVNPEEVTKSDVKKPVKTSGQKKKGMMKRAGGNRRPRSTK